VVRTRKELPRFFQDTRGEWRQPGVPAMEIFEGVRDARALTASWEDEYNTQRPHSSLGYQTDLPPLNEATWGARILGDHTMTMLKRQLKQVMEQVGCERVTDLPKHLVPSSA
jgi:hypothetical protein